MNDKYIDELEDKYKLSYLDFKKGRFNTEEWGSHQPLLIHTVNTITEGSVMELGIGDNSTPLLHLLCEKQGRKLYSYEFDEQWYDKYKHYENENHELFLITGRQFKDKEFSLHWLHHSILFIDSHPSWTRQWTIDNLTDNADYFIVHDTYYTQNGQIKSDNNYNFDKFKYVKHFNKVNRVSTLFSNKEMPSSLTEIFT